MTLHSTIARRLQFAAIDARTSAVLKQAKLFILEAMPTILDGFYNHVGNYQETATFFGSREHMMHAKAMQLKHWAIILDGAFDADYERSVMRIGEVHNKLGLEPRWYIGGYNVLVAGLLSAVAERHRGGWFRKAANRDVTELQVAISKAAILDMDLAISTYVEAGRRDRHQTLEQLADNFQTAIGGVVEAVAAAATQLQSVAQSVTEATQRTASQSGAVASSSEATSTSVQAVAAASEQLTSSISEIARRVNDSAQVTNSAARSAEDTRGKMNRLAEGVQKIGSIVDLIASVAEQTNLLALNATIEAARAGDAGRGFAVVAQEVKSLAEQTAKATADIAAQIADIQSATTDSSASIAHITTVVGTLSEISTAIASAVEEQGAATNEIARNVQQAARGTGEMSASLAEVTASAGRAGATASDVLASADRLSQQSDLLRSEVGKFLTTVRAA
jgi:methyl-accepting chemotaxis protein